MQEIQKQIDRLLAQGKQIIVAIDGPCTSGKTTLAGKLCEIYNCNVFHMDDFSSAPSSELPNGSPKQAAMWTMSVLWTKFCFP